MQSSERLSLYVTGLKNAHALENQALSIMKPQVERLQHYPEMEARLRQHITETEAQLQRIDGLLSGMGESASGLKDIALSFTGAMAALGHTVAPDEVIKNSFANYAFEHFEIAAYKSLITMAEAAGATQALTALQQNLREEESMAAWIDQNLAPTTLKYISLREMGETAKR